MEQKVLEMMGKVSNMKNECVELIKEGIIKGHLTQSDFQFTILEDIKLTGACVNHKGEVLLISDKGYMIYLNSLPFETIYSVVQWLYETKERSNE